MMEKLVAENDALTDHLNRQSLELSNLRAAMTTAATFAAAADQDAQNAEAAAAAAVGYLPPASPMRELSGGLGSLQRALSDTSAAVAIAAGLPSPGRPASAAAGAPPASPLAGVAGPGGSRSVPASPLQGQPAGGAAWELPGGVMLSEQQLQLLALAEEVEKLQVELEKQRSRGAALEAQLIASGAAAAAPHAGMAGANGASGVAPQAAPAPAAAAPVPAAKPPKKGYSFWQFIAGADRVEAAQ